MSPIRDALDDLVTEVPSHVVPEDLAGTAWRSGRRRRIRKRITGSVGAVGVVVALVVAILPVVNNLSSAPPASDPDDPGGAGVTSYPERIGHQWWVRDLPDRPGPVAGLVDLVDERDSWDEPVGWHVLSQGGYRWRLPTEVTDTHPTISPNGRYLGYLESNVGPYVIHDLVTGEKVDFPEIGSGVDYADNLYFLNAQSPSFWSPDGTRVVIHGAVVGAETVNRLVLGVDGSLTRIEGEWIGQAAGWANNDELVWVTERRTDPSDTDAPIEGVVANVTSLDGELVRTVQLQRIQAQYPTEPAPWATTGLSQWIAVVSPDGSEILIVDEVPDVAPHSFFIRRFSMADGSETASYATPWLDYDCAPGWTTASVPIVPRTEKGRGWNFTSTAFLADGFLFSLVAVEPGLNSRCLIWAGDALAGEARGGLFGLTTWWWTWWWREIVGGLALLAIAGLLLWRWRRRTHAAIST